MQEWVNYSRSSQWGHPQGGCNSEQFLCMYQALQVQIPAYPGIGLSVHQLLKYTDRSCHCRDRIFATAENCPPQPNFLNSPFDSSDSIWLDWLVESTTQWGPSQCSREFRWLGGSPNFYSLLIIVPIAILYLRSPYIRKWGEKNESYEQKIFISINSHLTFILGQKPTTARRCCPRTT